MTDADALATAIESADDLEAALWDLWGSVIAEACRTDPSEQRGLVELVMALGERPDVGEVWGLTVWSDLPLLGPQLREAWSWAAPPATTDDTWPNLNAFVAQLAVEGVDVALLGLWAVRSAFEDEASTRADHEAARAWFEHAGEELRRWSRDHRSFEGLADPGYSPERLARWEHALARLSDS